MKQFNNGIQQIPGWLSKNEGNLLAYFAKRAGGAIVEIGSFQGKSTVYMALATTQKVYAIDPHLGKVLVDKKPLGQTYAAFLKNIKKFGVGKNVVPIRKTSAAANKNWSQKIALLHIDGLHEYEFAKQDLRLWLPYLDNDGVVICHDAFGPYFDVFRAVKEEIFQKGDWKYIGALDSQIFAVKGKPGNIFEKLNIDRQKFFLTLASNIWHNEKFSQELRFFLVNRGIKIFFMNVFMFKAMLKLDL